VRSFKIKKECNALLYTIAETLRIKLYLGYELWLALAWKPCTRNRAGIVAANIQG